MMGLKEGARVQYRPDTKQPGVVFYGTIKAIRGEVVDVEVNGETWPIAKGKVQCIRLPSNREVAK